MPDYCKIFNLFTKINPAYPLVLESSCKSGCNDVIELNFLNKIFYRNSTETTWTNLDPSITKNLIYGETDYEFTITSKLFSLFPNYIYWRVTIDIDVLYIGDDRAVGSTAMNIKINEKPYNGSCDVSPTSGFALSDQFLIKCKDWVDNDGFIVRYEYFAKYSDRSAPIAINYNPQGVLTTQLPQGLKKTLLSYSFLFKLLMIQMLLRFTMYHTQ